MKYSWIMKYVVSVPLSPPRVIGEGGGWAADGWTEAMRDWNWPSST